jgi:hypothetical protein
MSFQRVILNAEELRVYKPAFPPLKPHPLQNLLDQAQPSKHVTAEFAFAVAVDMMGLDVALNFVQTAPVILNTWIGLIESHGWNRNLKQHDLQINLIVNAIKFYILTQKFNSNVRESETYAIIEATAKGNARLKMALISALILNKGLDIPWVLVANLPANASSEFFGVWSNEHYKQ